MPDEGASALTVDTTHEKFPVETIDPLVFSIEDVPVDTMHVVPVEPLSVNATEYFRLPTITICDMKAPKLYEAEYTESTRITDNIWLGNYGCAVDEDFLRNNNISCVVNCTDKLEFLDLPYIDKVRVALEDDASMFDMFLDYVPDGAKKINEAIVDGKNVYVHCAAGINRSATTLAAYFMLYKNFTPIEAVRFIRAQRPCTFASIYLFHVLNVLFLDTTVIYHDNVTNEDLLNIQW